MRRCIACGRPLKDTDSVIRGYGPKCYEEIFGKPVAGMQHYKKNAAIPQRMYPARGSPRKKKGIPGQLALDLQE